MLSGKSMHQKIPPFDRPEAKTSNPSVPQNQQQIPPPDPMPGFVQFGDPDSSDQAFNLHFSDIQTRDVMNDFNFDNFFDRTVDATN